MFEKTLQDLVKGIRSNKKDPEAYVQTCIQEIKNELKSRDVALKAQALQKLTYLHMLGHDVSWAAFHTVEMMTQDRFAFKRVGMLMAAQSFTPETDVILLTTQQFKKDFSAKTMYEVGIGIDCLSNIVTKDLARDLLNDVVTMLTSSRPYIRKKAVLCLYKMFLQYPQGLRLCFDALKRRLEDDNLSVVSCAVNVICELARKKPANFLSLAPDMFRLLTSSHNNWMLIKVVKLLGALVAEEPRLARKLLAPLSEIISTTPAKSLMYECISTATVALQFTKKADGTDARNAPAVVRLCTEKLREFIKETDQNLKYLGLVGLVNLMRSHPRVVAEHRDLVLHCLLDDDVTIRLRALELITGMVTRRNLTEIVKRLMDHVGNAEGHYRDELIDKIIFICSRDRYEYLQDFAWYIGVLVRLAKIQGTKHAGQIAAQLLDVSVRVEVVRPFAVTQMVPLLRDVTSGQRENMGDVLSAAAWITGEYADLLESPEAGEQVIDALAQPATASLPPDVQCVYIQCVVKVLAAACRLDAESEVTPVAELALSVCERLQLFAQSEHVEVQERASGIQALLVGLGVPFTLTAAEGAAADPPADAAAGAAGAATGGAAAAAGDGGDAEGKGAEAETAASEAAPAAAAAVADADADAAAPAAEAAAATDGAAAEAESEATPAEGAAAEEGDAAGDGEAAAAAATTAPSGVNGAADGSGAAPAAAAAATAALPAAFEREAAGAVLAALFNEALKPVSDKAQRKVKVPDGLDLDAWIVDEARESAESAPPAPTTMSVSFAEAYTEGRDGVYAGTGGSDGRPSGGGSLELGLDSDDEGDLFLELSGGKRKKGSKKVKKAERDAARESRRREREADPFMLGGGGGGGGGPASREDDIDGIPIQKLDLGDLGASEGLAVGGKKHKKHGKKGRTRRSSSDAPPPVVSYSVDKGEDLPSDAASSDEERRKGGAGGGPGSDDEATDLAQVDLTKPLGEHERMPELHHRTPGAGAGRADRAKESGSKKAKKEKKDKKEKASKKDKSKKAAKAGAGAGAAGAAGAGAGASAEKSSSKHSKKDKKHKSKKGAGGEAEGAAAPAAGDTASVTLVDSGDTPPARERKFYPLFSDKNVRVSYQVNVKRVCSEVPSEAAVRGAAAALEAGGAGAGSKATVFGAALVTFKVEGRSSKKAVSSLDIAFARPGKIVRQMGGGAVRAGAAVRLAADLAAKPKDKKGKDKKGGAPGPNVATTDLLVTLGIEGVHKGIELDASVTYAVGGGDADEPSPVTLRIRASSLLVPVAISQESYATLMREPPSMFYDASGTLPADGEGDAALDTLIACLPSTVAMSVGGATVLYCRSFQAHHVTVLLKPAEGGGSVGVTIKSTHPAQASALLEDLQDLLGGGDGGGAAGGAGEE